MRGSRRRWACRARSATRTARASLALSCRCSTPSGPPHWSVHGPSRFERTPPGPERSVALTWPTARETDPAVCVRVGADVDYVLDARPRRPHPADRAVPPGRAARGPRRRVARPLSRGAGSYGGKRPGPHAADDPGCMRPQHRASRRGSVCTISATPCRRPIWNGSVPAATTWSVYAGTARPRTPQTPMRTLTSRLRPKPVRRWRTFDATMHATSLQHHHSNTNTSPCTQSLYSTLIWGPCFSKKVTRKETTEQWQRLYGTNGMEYQSQAFKKQKERRTDDRRCLCVCVHETLGSYVKRGRSRLCSSANQKRAGQQTQHKGMATTNGYDKMGTTRWARQDGNDKGDGGDNGTTRTCAGAGSVCSGASLSRAAANWSITTSGTS